MTAGYLTVTGISSFIQQTNATNVAVGQLATTLGILPSRLAAYEEAARRANINPQSMASTLSALNSQSGAAKLGLDGGSFYSALSRLGVSPLVVNDKDPMVALRAITAAAQKQLAAGTSQNEVNALLTNLHLNQDMIYMIDRRDKGLQEFLNTSINFNATTNDQVESSTKLLSVWDNFIPTLTKLGNSITKDLDDKLIALSPILKVVDDHLQLFKDLLESIGGLLIGGGIGAAIGAIIGFFVPIPGATAAGALIGGRIGAAVGLATGVGVAASSSDPNLAAAPPGGGGSNTVAPAGSGTTFKDRWNALTGSGATAPGSGGIGPQSNIGGRSPASIRYNNPGAQWPNAHAKQFGMDSYGHLADGNLIAHFPTPEQGAAANMDLFKRSYVGMTVGAAGQKWTGSNSFGVPGYNSNMVVTQEMMSDPNFTIPFMKAMAGREAGRKSPLTEEQWSRAFEMYRAGGSKNFDANRAAIPPHASPTGSTGIAPAAQDDGWTGWLGRHLPSLSPVPLSSNVHNKQSSLSIGNMNFHGVRDMKDVADNIEPFISNRFSAVAADTGYG
jgi:hypothetical protein